MIKIKTFEMEATFKKDESGAVSMSDEKVIKESESVDSPSNSILGLAKEVSDFNQKELAIVKASIEPEMPTHPLNPHSGIHISAKTNVFG